MILLVDMGIHWERGERKSLVVGGKGWGKTAARTNRGKKRGSDVFGSGGFWGMCLGGLQSPRGGITAKDNSLQSPR